MILEWWCLCKSLLYSINLDERDHSAWYCHCSICRKSSWSIVNSWLQIKSANFSILQWKLKEYDSSSSAKRMFCEICWTQIAFQYNNQKEYIDITVWSLDIPEKIDLKRHVCTSSKISWLDINNNLIKYIDDWNTQEK